MKTFTIKTFLFLGLGLLTLSKTKAQQNRPLSDFTRIHAGGVVDIQLFIADRHSIYIDAKYPERVKAEVENGTLNINTNNRMKDEENIVVKLYLKELKGLEISGAVNVMSADTIRTEQLTIDANGAARCTLLLNSTSLKVNAEGASKITLSGLTDTENIKLSGASVLNAYDLVAPKITIQTSGASKGKVNVTELLSAEASGASQIVFSGNPQYKNISINGVATVTDKIEGNEFTSNLSQGVDRNGDTTKVKIGKKKYIIIDEGDDTDDKPKVDENRRRRMKSVWGGFALGLQGMTTSSMNFTMPTPYKFLNTKVGESWFFDLNLPELDGHIIKNKLAITTGLGFTWNNVHFEGNDVLTPHIDSLGATPSAAGTNLSLNKLYTFDITAPILIKLAPGTKRRAKGGFHIAAGAIIHYVAVARVVTETSSGGYDQRVELNDDFNINPFRVDATVRFGYGKLKLFANYALTPYFNKDKAPDVRLFSGGITLVGF
jgi:hypothetical protein